MLSNPDHWQAIVDKYSLSVIGLAVEILLKG
jgi:hypothetical protein